MARDGKIGMVSFQIDPEGKIQYLDGKVKDVNLNVPENSRSISSMHKNNDDKSIER